MDHEKANLGSKPERSGSALALTLLVVFAAIYGFLYRVHPLAMGPERLAQFFVTEDGYLMLTVARNLALGNGLSVSDATIPTNGVQPLATFLYAIPYWFTGGDKTSSLVGVLAIMVAWSVGSAVALAYFARELLRPLGAGRIWPWATAMLWFVGPLPLLHSMNALETGLYVGMVALTVAAFGAITARGGRYSRRDQWVIGLLCGMTFLVRIDGALLVISLFATRLVYMPLSRQLSIRDAIAEAIVPGLITIALVAPWLIHNQVFFGSIMPISGTAQSLSAGLGENLPELPSRLFETMLPMLPIPQPLENRPPIIAFCLIVLTPVLMIFLWRIHRLRHPFAVAIWVYMFFAIALVSYYGLFFGARHFLSRYFAPLAPLLIGAAVWVVLDLLRHRRLLAGRLPMVLMGLGLIMCLGLSTRLVLPGVKEQGHFHVVGWVQENVEPETWVAAIQTGTLGYWHDRTINLDGKVNPEALEARRVEGNVLSYVTDSKIDVIADWIGVSRWVTSDNERFNQTFEVVVEDRRANLGVLRRRSGAGE